MTATIRTHVALPRDLVEEIDRIAGQRRRSEFTAETLEREVKLRRRAELANELS